MNKFMMLPICHLSFFFLHEETNLFFYHDDVNKKVRSRQRTIMPDIVRYRKMFWSHGDMVSKPLISTTSKEFVPLNLYVVTSLLKCHNYQLGIVPLGYFTNNYFSCNTLQL